MSGAALRRALHASTAALVLLPNITTWTNFRLIVGALFAVAAVIELARLKAPAFARWLARAVPVYRSAEAHRPSGGFWLAMGYALAVAIPAPPAAATAGIVVAALADPAGSLVGSTFSRAPGKSWIGSFTIAGVAWLVLSALALPVDTAVSGALLAALVERVPPPLDDNLFIAPAVTLAALALA